MKLKIYQDPEKKCCFEYWENGAMRKCGSDIISKAGTNQYLCREHTSYASQFAKDFQNEKGNEITMSNFFKIIGETL